MQMSDGRKAFYITFSILLSFVVWFLVNNKQGVDVPINDIPVEFLNAESSLANKGLMLLNGDDTTVDLILTMPRSMVYGFDTERVRVTANLISINSTGTQTLQYSVVYPSGVDRSQISVRSPEVQNISVQVGSLFRRDDVEVRCKVVGNVADGYVAGSVQLLPSTLELWGQQSDVMQVSYAQVTLNVENARSTIVELLEYELYDYNGQLIENKNLHAASNTVQVTMPVIAATDIPLVVDFKESPGVRLGSFDYSLDTTSVTLSGDANLIAQLDKIVLGEIDLAQIDSERTITYEIPIPDGLNNLSGTSSATLRIANRDVTTKNVTVTSFDYENFDAEDRSVEVVTSSISVTLRGTGETLEAIDDEDVQVVADLSGVTDASGTYTVPGRIRIEGEPDVGATQNYQLTVRIGAAGMNEPNGGETTDGDTTGTEASGTEDDGAENPNGEGTDNEANSNG